MVSHSRKYGTALFCAVLLLLVTVTASGADIFSGDSGQHQRQKIGLVLSGGGARGAAHVGVIKVLEQLRVPIDCITGTSMGSIVGGLYASGMSVEEIESTITSIDWADAFNDQIPREDRSFRRKEDDNLYLVKNKPGISDEGELKLPSGFLQGQKVDLILKRLTLPVSNISNFDDFSIPFRAVATDVTTGEAVVLGSGDLALAMRASMSIPAAFSPVDIGGRLLVDGGVSNNLPVDVARNLGADIVIVVDISTPLLPRENLTSALTITKQLTGILTRRNTEEQLATLTEKDVLIVPELGDITSSSFERAGEAVPFGFIAAEEKRQRLVALSLSPEEYEKHLAARLKRKKARPVIEFVRLDNRSRLKDDVLLARLHIEKGQPLDVARLEADIGRIYGLELFENIRYAVVEEDGRSGLVIHARERSWGPNYLQLGLAISDDFKGDNTFNLALAYTRTAVNRLAGEWRTFLQIGDEPLIATELYQPLDVSSRYFVHPLLFYGKENINVFSPGGSILAEYQLTRYGIDIAAGRDFGAWGEGRLGYRRFSGDAEVQVGSPTLPDVDFDKGEAYLKFSVDKLDNPHFPNDGGWVSLEYIMSEEGLGADSTFDQVLFDSFAARTWGRYTALFGVRFYTTPGDDAPLQNRFRAGGLFNLSGFTQDQLSGQHFGLLRLGALRRIGDFNLMPTYVGAFLESGNVWEYEDDISSGNMILAGSLFVGVDTFLGPVYLAYGLAEYSNESFYLFIGTPF